MLLACYSHKHISYRIRTIIRKAIDTLFIENNIFMNTYFNLPEFYTVELIANISSLCIN
ncbi:hypothetical protein [Wolbachia endosymbiont (group A) of Aleiodes leptofemur]|uniref:hypothetical protein n=1 Tax=Wolbachia endosymbiont (group A) of Aleiodes leptofemur TaxID=3077919 RepID=UPI00333EB038